MAVLGVLSDTHIPDRARLLSPRALEVFRSTSVAAILHAGDISTAGVLQELGQIAPVYAVRGNRDIYTLRHLPAQVILTFDGFKVGMVHGHGRLHNYLVDKARILVFGIQEAHYKQRVIEALPGVDVMIFGHLHRRIREWVGGVLLLNPGSACCPDGHSGNPPSVVVLRLVPGSRPDVQFFDLRD
jgi:putative phosphoesterase